MKSPLATTPPVLSNASFAAPALPQRQVRSFVRRAGRTTAAQARAFEQFGPEFLIPFQPSLSALAALYPQLAAPELGAAPISGAPAPPHRRLVLEIGFGMGEATAHIAALMPDVDFLCCEVHPPGVGALLKRIGESGLHNVRIIAHDAVEVMEQMLPLWQASAPARGLDGVHLFFPDPWHKKRHNKRRLIQPELVAKLAARLKPGGVIHCATDWQPYAEQMLSVLGSELLLCNTATTGQSEPDGFVPRPHYRPLTKFEQRGLRLGHGVWDLLFERV